MYRSAPRARPRAGGGADPRMAVQALYRRGRARSPQRGTVSRHPRRVRPHGAEHTAA
eukprot:CAMPEP_0179215440 /NCGR_PEP_ID=MMETSP0797-20121207/2853_1 /TAXON_ID=47934 /ORGANISM="Dinophysis acuminata, Strain DAEP01" /LENGTH=56 /DNA_ID=CAMNT_0020921545 /DNA_START=132 /DNA_END=298 /DNA_ORIENTATION=-